MDQGNIILSKLVSRFGQTLAGRLRVRSALNPLLYLTIFGSVCLLFFASIYEEPYRKWLVITAIILFGMTVVAYFVLLIFMPDRLQSEEYQIRRQTLELIEQKGGEIAMLPTAVESISNPEHKSLPHTTGGH